jgi:hypothetical protein
VHHVFGANGARFGKHDMAPGIRPHSAKPESKRSLKRRAYNNICPLVTGS